METSLLSGQTDHCYFLVSSSDVSDVSVCHVNAVCVRGGAHL